MNKIIMSLVFSMFCSIAFASDVSDYCIDSAFVVFGSNHKICISTFQDPLIPEITCKISQARTGGITGSLGLAEDLSYFSISCIKTADIKTTTILPEKEEIFKKSTSILFKKTKIYRIYQNGIVTYLAMSEKLIDGSPFNAISLIQLK